MSRMFSDYISRTHSPPEVSNRTAALHCMFCFRSLVKICTRLSITFATHQSANYLIGWLIEWSVDWLIGWLVDWLINWKGSLASFDVGHPIDCIFWRYHIRFLIVWLTGCFFCLIDWLVDWLVDWRQSFSCNRGGLSDRICILVILQIQKEYLEFECLNDWLIIQLIDYILLIDWWSVR